MSGDNWQNYTGYILDDTSVRVVSKTLRAMRSTGHPKPIKVQVQGRSSGSARWEKLNATLSPSGVLKV